MTGKRDTILVYCDYGCMNLYETIKQLKNYWEPLGYNVKITDAENIKYKNSLNDSVFAFVMPGGAGLPYELKLKDIGNEKIREFVKKGGIYLGFCAGAYYACTNTIFEKDIPEIGVISKGNLDLIDANAVGSLYKQLGIAPYSSNIKSCAVADVTFKDQKTYSAFYSGGPYFELKDESKVDVLGYYSFKKDAKQPAILKKVYGDGVVIISGVHPEISGESIKSSIYTEHPEYKEASKFAEKLISVEDKRKALFDSIMKETLKTK